jgi:hypothetical protein
MLACMAAKDRADLVDELSAPRAGDPPSSPGVA